MTFPDAPTITEIVGLACLAPSIHNTQPWRWVVQDGALQLYGDTHRQLMYADVNRRDLVLSCGAALHHLTVAAAAAGWACRITRVADPEYPMHLADVRFAPRPPRPEDLRLAGAVSTRRTDRRQVSSWPVPSSTVDRLIALAQGRGVLAGQVPAHHMPVIQRALAGAARLQSHNEAYLDELLAWTSPSSTGGVPATSIPDRAAADPRGDRSRFPAGSLQDEYAEDSPPGAEWLVLSTSSDDVLSWLRAGEALSAVWLAATVAGLSLVPFTQPVEVEQTRVTLQSRLLDGQSCPQVILRIGWPQLSHTPPPPTPRRPLEELLEFQVGS